MEGSVAGGSGGSGAGGGNALLVGASTDVWGGIGLVALIECRHVTGAAPPEGGGFLGPSLPGVLAKALRRREGSADTSSSCCQSIVEHPTQT